MMSKRIVSLLLALMLVCAGVVALAAEESTTKVEIIRDMQNGTTPQSTQVELGTVMTLPPKSEMDRGVAYPKPEGKVFYCWQICTPPDSVWEDVEETADNGYPCFTVHFPTTVRAVWIDEDISWYTLTIDTGTGETMNEMTVPDGENFVLPSENALPLFREADGYAYKHWQVTETESGETVGEYFGRTIITATANMTATAIWADPTTIWHTVSFNGGNGGTGSMEAVSVNPGEYILPECSYTAPEGMRFLRWRSQGKYYQPGDKATIYGKTNFTAEWEAVSAEYTVSFDANGGFGSMAGLAANAENEYTIILPECKFEAPIFGFGFTGWYANNALYQPGDSMTVTGDTNVLAAWEGNDFQLHYSNNYGGIICTLPMHVGDKHVLLQPTDPLIADKLYDWEFNGLTGDHFNFAGWAYHLGWAETGEAVFSETMNPGDLITIDGGTELEPKIEKIIYAIWNRKQHQVHFDANGGTGTMDSATVDAASSYSVPECTFTAPTGHHFSGWELNGEMYVNGAVNGSIYVDNSDVTLKAIWEPDDCWVRFNPNDGGNTALKIVDYGTDYKLPTPEELGFAAAEGKAFYGWELNGSLYQPNDTLKITEPVIDIFAEWTTVTKLSFDANGGTGEMDEMELVTGTAYVLPECGFTAPEGMSFKGWLLDGFEHQPGDTVYGGSGYVDRTATAVWNADYWTITFTTDMTGDDMTQMKSLTVEPGASFELPACTMGTPSPSLEFSHWEIDGKNYKPGEVIESVTANLTVRAQWKTKLGGVAYVDDNYELLEMIADIEYGTVLDVKDAVEDFDLTAPEGMKFNCWIAYDMDGNIVGEAYTNPEWKFPVLDYYTLVPNWVAIDETKVYRLTFDMNGGNPLDYIEVTQGAFFELPPAQILSHPDGLEFDYFDIGDGNKYYPHDLFQATGDVVAVAHWKGEPEVVEYTVTYNPGRGTGEIKTETATAGVQFPLINPAQLGYAAPEGEAFKAWSVEGVEHGMFDFIDVTKDITVTALWEAGECTVSFDANGGSGTMEPVTIAKGADFEIPACGFFAPLGKQFKAWELDGFELKPDDVINPIYDETLKAIWEDAPEVNYTITFDANGGEGTMEDVTWQAGTYYLPWCTFEREGHNFAGWLVNGEGEPMDAYDTITLSSDIELIATWDPHVYTIHFSAGIGEDGNNSAGANLDKTYGVGFTLPDPSELGFTCEHHEFIGWTDETNGPSENAKFYAKGAEFVPKSFTILVAQWEPLKYKVSFNPGEGGTGEMADGVATYGFPYSLPECTFTAPEGHEFKAWLMNGREVPEGNSLLAEEDTIITAVWEPKTYTITYDLNGMTGSGYGPVEIKYGETHNLRDPEGIEIPENMHFDGWQVGENKYGPGYPLKVTGDTTVVAQWKERLVSLTYLDDEGNEIKKFDDLKYGSDHTELKPEELKLTAPEGYEFNCWLVLNTRHEVIGEQNPYDTVPMKVFSNWLMQANWVKKTQQYTLTLDMNGGDPIEGYSVYEGAYFELPRPEVIGHPKEFEFDYFDIGDGNKYYPGDYILATADVTAKAIWMAPAAVEYTITYDANGGKGEMVPQTVIEGVEQGLSANLFGRPGYTFAGWNTAADGSGTAYAADATIVPTTDVTLYAQWTAIPYTITFDGGDAPGSMDSVTKLFGETYVLPECGFQSPINNRFKAWDVNGTEYAVGDTITVTGDVTVKPVWEWISYTVTFDAQGGTGAMEPLSVLAGTSINAPLCGFTAPEGMLFEAWHVDDELYADSYKVGDEIVVYGDVTLKAGWTKSEYKVTYKSSDAQDARIYEDPIAVGSAYKLLDNMFTAPEGKQFRCWLFPVPPTFTETEELDPGTEFSSVSADLTFIADWEAIECSVSFDANGGSGAMEAETVEYGTDYVLPDCTFTAPEGKEFVAWEIDGVRYLPDDSVIIKGGVTVKAVWSVQALAVSFEGGEYGSGNMASEMASYGEPYTLPSCGYSYPSESVVFIGWKLGGTYYAPGDEVVLYEDTTFTAMWADRWYTFSFVDSYDNSVKASKTIEYGQRLTLGNPADYGMAAKEYHMFAHWDVGGTAYAPGDSIRYSANKTVKAMWTFDNSVETVVIETPVELKPEMTEEELNEVLEEVFDDVVATVPSIETPAQIVEEIEEAVPAGYEPESMTLQNVELMFKPAGSDTWIKATEENFPTTGILHTLDFTEGTSAATHDYKILHMIVTGDKAGTVEEIEPEVVDENGVTGRFYSLSPISVVHKLKPVEETIPDGALELLPETGDPSSLIGWITLLGASGVSLRAIKRRKK